jgi:hypothetical protein
MAETPSGLPNDDDEITPLGVPDDDEDGGGAAEGEGELAELPGFPEGEPHTDG